MSYTDTSLTAQAPVRGQVTAGTIRGLFVATICTSAFLLFLIQPMYSKMVIPLVGGAPGVWTTAMLFFQSILLAGYAYAHWLASSFAVSRQRQIHLAVTALAVFSLPLAVPTGWVLPDDGSVTPWLLGLFAVSIGAPFFALSANSPLLQEWYAKSGNKDGADPYFLYAASNIGSFGALLAYPLLIEPSVGLADQGRWWSIGYVALMLGIAASGLVARDAPKAARAGGAVEEAPAAPLSRRDVMYWMLLSFVPSSIMLSVTAKIATDIGSFPLIWVTTLALYLLSYVFAFSARFRARAGLLPRIHMLLTVAMFGFLCMDRNEMLGWFEMAMVLGFLFVTALCFHTRLAGSRPDSRHLTAFFLSMSAGGALGGVFNSILAPMLFDNIHEFTIAVALAFAAAPLVRVDWKRDMAVAALVAVLLAVFVLVARSGAVPMLQAEVGMYRLSSLLIGGAIVVVLMQSSGRPLRQVAVAGFALAAVTVTATEDSLMMRERSFFGVYEVHDFPEDSTRYIKHGTTNHGEARTDMATQQPAAYYAPSGAFGQFFDMLPAGSEVGIVGLGAGGLSCRRPDEIGKVFYEIDPLVDRIARNTAYFDMLATCAPDAPTIIGDARIELEKQPDAVHDHLVLDAFSSDAVPSHLLTREAFAIYERIVPRSGSIFVHISNRHFDLEGPVARVAEAAGFTVFVQRYKPDARAEEEERAAFVVGLIATRDADTVARLKADTRWSAAQAWDRPIWTDDYADTLSAWK